MAIDGDFGAFSISQRDEIRVVARLHDFSCSGEIVALFIEIHEVILHVYGLEHNAQPMDAR
jgi:hypothetical protein